MAEEVIRKVWETAVGQVKDGCRGGENGSTMVNIELSADQIEGCWLILKEFTLEKSAR